MSKPGRPRFGSILLAAIALLGAGGCATVVVRNAAPEEGLSRAQPYGIQDNLLRSWGDGLDPASVDFVVSARAAALAHAHGEEIARGETVRTDTLALSGGGPDGAFGAGLLAGWTARGDRPEFEVVSGVSTGAIIALFAFLGPEHDEALREIYTQYETDDIAVRTIFSGLAGGVALLDVSGYRSLINAYVSDEIVADIAEAYRNGRILLIGTTNLDASRPVVWNIGAIAASGDPNAATLIRDVVQASSAIPGAFPPVLIPVEIGGAPYDEMHVDGGATQQVMLFSPEISAGDIDARANARVERRIWVVINNKLSKPYEPVEPRSYDIAAKAGSSLIGGSGAGDVYRLYSMAERDGSELKVISVPPDFMVKSNELFDPAYMAALYERGYEEGLAGEGWSAYPPGFKGAAPARR